MQTNPILTELIENPVKLKKFYDGYELIISDARKNGHYEALAEHKKTLKWLKSEIELMTDD